MVTTRGKKKGEFDQLIKRLITPNGENLLFVNPSETEKRSALLANYSMLAH